jgi:hypothetical protein
MPASATSMCRRGSQPVWRTRRATAVRPTPDRGGRGPGTSGPHAGGAVHPAVAEDRRRHLSALQTGALPLVRAIAGGVLDPDDAGVRRRCAAEARALRNALAHERHDDDFFFGLRGLDDTHIREVTLSNGIDQMSVSRGDGACW